MVLNADINEVSGCSAVGSALRSGRRSRQFESGHPDRINKNDDPLNLP